MAARIPPLTSLRAFEAAARLNSFTKAADDLCVTPAAVSQQIKQLEEHLGLRLFDRTNKGIAITEAGEHYYPMIFAGFEMLRKASQQIRNFLPSDQLVVSMLPSLASQWLGTSLLRWCADNPAIQIAIVATHAEPDFEGGEAHVRICYGAPRQRSVEYEELMTDRVAPMCSPALLGGHPPLENPEEILDFPLIHIDWGEDNDTLPSWREWLSAVGVDTEKGPRGLVFNLSSLAVRAATSGKGFVLGQQMMASDDLDEGRLVKPFEFSLPLRESYYVAYPSAARNHPHFESFLAWLRALMRTKGGAGAGLT